MRRWSDEIPAEPVVLKHSHILRLWAAHNGDLDRLRESLAAYRDEALRTAEEAAAHARGAQAGGSLALLRCGARVVRAGSHRDEAARIDWLIERLSGMR